MKCSCLFLSALVLATSGQAWVVRFHPDSGDATPPALAVDRSGYVHVTAAVPGEHGTDYLVVKYGPGGSRPWTVSRDGPYASDDVPAAIAVDDLGRVYVTGTCLGPNGWDFRTLCLAADGQVLWDTTFDGTSHADDRAVQVVADNAGNCFVTGTSYFGANREDDIVTLFYDSIGTELWSKAYNGPGQDTDYVTCALLDDSGCCVLAGASYGIRDTFDFVVIRYSPTGTVRWLDRQRMGSKTVPRSLHTDLAQNLYVTGSSHYGTTAGWDAFTAKYAHGDSFVWTARYNGPGFSDDHGHAFDTDLDTLGYLAVLSFQDSTLLTVVGYLPTGGMSDFRIIRLSPDSAWVQTGVLGRTQAGFVLLGSIQDTATGWDYFAAGYDTVWDPEWEIRYHGPVADDVVTAYARDRNSFYLTGQSQGETGTWDIVTAKYSLFDPGITSRPTPGPENVFRIWPNPARSQVCVFPPAGASAPGRLTLHDALGREVPIQNPNLLTTAGLALDTRHLPAGVYFLRLELDDQAYTGRVTISH